MCYRSFCNLPFKYDEENSVKPTNMSENEQGLEIESFLQSLKENGFEGEVSCSYPQRLVHSTDNSIYQLMPKAVVYPARESDSNVLARMASEKPGLAISFAPRGGGTGTNGQSLNTGIVVETSKYLNQILDFDETAMTVTVQPGVVLDQLNAFLKEYGFFFPPMVSTSSRATLGGMTGTDASGKGSRIYGKVSDYIEEMDVVLSNGESWTARTLTDQQLKEIMARDDLVGSIHRQVYLSISENKTRIEQIFPKMNRGLTGYNLQNTLKADGTFNLAYLLAGSEGSLCFTQKLTFRVKELPKSKGLVSIGYETFNDALEGVKLILKSEPLAVEVVDDKILTLSQEDIIWSEVEKMLGNEPVLGMNFVEFIGDSAKEVQEKISDLEALLEKRKGGKGQAISWRSTLEPVQISALWEMRKKSVGLLGRLQGKGRALPFVEDTAVPPEKLADFIREFRMVLDENEVDYGMFGHADVGCLHVRPTLDLVNECDQKKLRTISDKVSALTQKYGGLLWGEHGKGFRGEYSPMFFGPELYGELRKIKAAFDPNNVFNPGKIATPYTMADAKLIAIDEAPMRVDRDRKISEELSTKFPKAIHCNGNGACFNWDAYDPMCPSYKATRNRVQSPKGRAALLKEWMYLQSTQKGARSFDDFTGEVFQALKTCLSCKACASQCPIKVDIPEMKSKFLQSYYEDKRRPLRDHLVARMERLAWISTYFPHITNLLTDLGPVKYVMKTVFGLIDLPKVSQLTVRQGLKARNAPVWGKDAIGKRSVILVQDSFTTPYDSSVVLAHYDLLVLLGFQVFVTPLRTNGKPLHVKGFLDSFDKLARENDRFFMALAQSGLPMIGIENAVTLMFQQEYEQRLSNRPSYQIQSFPIWLLNEIKQKRIAVPKGEQQRFHLFAHCTEKTSLPNIEKQWSDIFAAFGHVLQVEKSGCCGMAGLFGHEAENEQMSKKLYDMSWRDKASMVGGERMLATGFSCRCQTKRYGGFRPRHPVEALVDLHQRD